MITARVGKGQGVTENDRHENGGPSKLPLLSQFHILLFYVLQFHALHIGPSISHPAFSAPPLVTDLSYGRNVESRKGLRLYGRRHNVIPY